MLITGKTYDTSTLPGLLELVSDTLGFPSDNLTLQLNTNRRQVTNLTLQIAQELRKADLSDENRAKLVEQLWQANRAQQMIDEAADLLRGAKALGAQLVPQPPPPELPPAPPIRRQTRRAGE